LEITSVNQLYLEENRLYAELMGRGFAWIDAGTIESLAEASEYIRIVEKQQNVMIAAVEELAYRNGWIGRDQLVEAADSYGNTAYAEHLRNVASGRFWV
jgi:glucose-1-phosphate thymidylyltransferase